MFVCCACSLAPAPAGEEGNGACARPQAHSSGPAKADPPSSSVAADPGDGVQREWAGIEA